MSITEVAGRMAELQTLVAQATGRIPIAAASSPAVASTGGAAWSATGEASVPASFAALLSGTSGAGGTAGPTGSAGTTKNTGAPGTTGAGAAAPAGVPTGGGDGGVYAPMIRAAAERHGIDPQVFTNLVRQESGFDPNAGSSAGARGLCQLMPGTAATLGVTDPTDPAQSLEGGATYLRQQLDRFGGDYRKALAAYNAGPGAVERFGGVPPYRETQHYVATILGGASA
ncbi:lytic transglycosylase domain-containing protein [Patulibacter sp. NPDC049589]|uniref:lytic transglycosylase domain-containing protein n=1 Tax=Patulibacter sp. NPDC049589 TaxID=3154731 RepID=UPI003419291E